MSRLDDLIKELNDAIALKLVDHWDKTATKAQKSPSKLENLSNELVADVTDLWNQFIDDLADLVAEEVNAELLESIGSLVPDDTKNNYKNVGVYFVLESIRRGLHFVHAASIALQLSDDDRQQAIDDATTKGQDSILSAIIMEAGFAYGAFTQLEQTSRGVVSYRWVTMRDDQVRPTHEANDNKIFNWDSPPDTGHPGMEHRCRCKAVPINTQTQSNLMDKTKIKAKPKGLAVRALAPNKARIDILGYIGDDWDGVNTTDWAVRNALPDDSITEIDVYINSNGGYLNHGIAIYNYLKNHPAKITTHNLGSASSAASIIFLAGDERIMPVGTTALIHNPWNCECGDYQSMDDMTRILKQTAESLIDVYAQYLQLSRDEIKILMDREEVFYGQYAVDVGFATALTAPIDTNVDDDQMAARVRDLKAAVAHHRNCEINSRNPKGVQNMADKEKPTIGTALADLQARHDVLSAKNTELAQENERLKADIARKEQEAQALKVQVKAEVLAEQVALSEAKAKVASIGLTEIKGDTATDVMRAAIEAKGVKNASTFEGEALQGIFDYVVSQYTDAGAYAAIANNSTDTPSNTGASAGSWSTYNKGAKK